MYVQSTRTQRLKESRSLRAKAPVAAQFEDCSQAFQQLSDSLQVKQSDAELHRTSKDFALRLRIWGDDSGASSRTLDYALRSSPVARRQTQRLLVELHSTLDQAIDKVQLPNPEDSDDEDAIDPSLLADQSNSINIDYDATADDEDEELTPQLLLEEAGDIIGHLAELLPALRDPPQEDDETVVVHDADPYLRECQYLAARLFPRASRELIRRLAYSNQRRYQSMLRSSGTSSANRTGRPLRGGLTRWDRRLGLVENHQKNDSELYLSDRAESDAGVSTIMSHADSVLTKIPYVDHESTTSATGISQPASVLQPFTLPGPPVDLERTEQFDCPFCQSVLPLTFSSGRLGMREWAAHVYHDLKPYICTFEDCFQEHRLYGDKGEWFQHELNFHRSRPVWFCGLCQTDFETACDLEDHFQSRHSETSPTELELILKTCKRYSEDPIRETHCALCDTDVDNVDELENHLGDHLETFALSTLWNDEVTDGERAEDSNMLAEYLAGLHGIEENKYEEGLLSADNETPPSTLINLVPTDTDFGHMEGRRASKRPDSLERHVKNDIWVDKVHGYITGQATQDSIPTVRHNVRPRYDNFVGRAEDLQRIHKQLSTPGRICTVSGRGGVGKTAISIEYLYEYENEYSYVFWVEAESPGLCAERYGSIASSLNMTERPLAGENARMSLVKEFLKTLERRWLLIFDNVASWKDISRYIPRNLPRTKGSVLVTTRSSLPLAIPPKHPSFHCQRLVELHVWCLEHSREFLLTSIQPTLKRDNLQDHEEYGQAEQVVDIVGRLPLAISMVVGYLKVSRCTLADFLEMWEEKEYIDRKKKKRKIDIGEGEIDTTMDPFWTIGIREVRMNSRRLLDILSFLDPETIQKSLLVGDHKEEYLEFLNSSESLSYKRMIGELSRRRLIAVKDRGDEPAYQIHRLLQQKILEDMEDYAFADAFRKAFRLIRKKFPAADPRQVPDPGTWDTCQEYIPHISTFCRIRNKNAKLISELVTSPRPTELAELFYDAGFYVWARQTTGYDGLMFLDTAEKILDEIQMDQNSKIRADILCLTGLLLLNMGCVERGKGFHRLEHALQIRKTIYTECPNHDNEVLLSNAANDFSLCLLNEHRFEDSGQYIRECRDRYLSWGPESENPFENSKYYGNYSTILMWKGEMEKAVEFQRTALGLTEKFSGRKGMYYRRLFMLACLRLQADDIQGALDTHMEALTARLELHGKHHEATILSTYAVGAMYHHLGDLGTATEYIQQCLEGENVSKRDKVATARSQYHLALLYREQGIEEDTVAKLEAKVDQVLGEFGNFTAECVRGAEDKMMILDDLQPTFLGRYTGRNLLKHLQKCLGHQSESSGG